MPVARTPAEYTVLRLQEAARGGAPVMIPAAWDPRAVLPIVQGAAEAELHSTIAAQMSAVSDAERLERELEGGGAPSQRPRARRVGVLRRLWLSAIRPRDIGAIWSRVLPQPG